MSLEFMKRSRLGGRLELDGEGTRTEHQKVNNKLSLLVSESSDDPS